jgi:hypothetical protein
MCFNLTRAANPRKVFIRGPLSIKSKINQKYSFFHSLNKKIMSVISILISLVIVGVFLWLINSFIPMDSKIKTILNAVVVIITLLWLLDAFGITSTFKNIHL